jgi:pilus assembly protein Flp/PilA
MLRTQLHNILTNMQDRQEGQGLVEYALILVLVAVVVIVMLSAVGGTVGNVFNQVNQALGGNLAFSNVDPADDPDDNNTTFSGTITAGDATDGFRYYDVCNFTVDTDGTYQIATVTTDKTSEFWVTGGNGSGPASGFSMESRKTTGVATSGFLTAGTPLRAYPHSTTPGDFPVNYEFTITGPGNVSGSC